MHPASLRALPDELYRGDSAGIVFGIVFRVMKKAPTYGNNTMGCCTKGAMNVSSWPPELGSSHLLVPEAGGSLART